MSKTKRSATATFERFAFQAQLNEHPADATARKAFQDWLEENGYSNIGARREVARLVREATECKLAELVNKNLAMSVTYHRIVHELVGQTRPRGRTREFFVHAIGGGTGPSWVPLDSRWTHPDGSLWTEERSPHAYMDDVRWVPRIWQVNVGAAWITLRCPLTPSSSATPARA